MLTFRRGARAALLLAAALTLVALPQAALPQAALAQDEPATPGPIYLPVVGGPARSADPDPAPTEIIFDGAIELDEEPVFDSPPKAAAADPEPAADPAPEPVEKPASVEPAAQDGWTTIKYEDFEGVPWPGAGWRIYDANGSTGGTYNWDDESYRPYRGGYSAWPAGSALNPASSNYPPNQRAWMIYGPFSLSDASRAVMTFQYYSQTELNYDYLGWFASPNGTSFYGSWVTGDSGGWRPGVIDFQNVPGYGSMLGDASVYVGFYFYSDASVQLKGPFIDDIFVQKFACPGQFTAFWYNAISPSSTSQRAVTCESYPFVQNWSTTSKLWTAVDKWSLQLTGRPYFNASRTWTFEARSDDGVRVWVDGVLRIDEYYDQGATELHTASVYLAQGYHDVFVQYYENTGGAQLTVRWY